MRTASPAPRPAALAAALLLLPVLAAAAPKVAVLEVAIDAGIDQSLVVPVTETLMESFVGSKSWTVLDRSYIDKVLAEKEFQLSGLVSDAEVAKAGQYLGADQVVAGRVQLAAGSYFMVAKMIDVTTGVITAQVSERMEGKVLLLVDLARAVGARLAGQSAGGVASTPASAAGGTATARQAPGLLKVGIIQDNAGYGPRKLALPLEYAGIYLTERFKDRVEVHNAYNVQPGGFAAASADLAARGCGLVFYLSGAFDAELRASAAANPGVRFVAVNHALPEDRPPGSLVVAGQWEVFNYVLGVLAGAASKTGKIGFLAFVPEPWQFRLINEFALGVKAANPKATVHVRYTGWDWNPTAALALARGLVAAGCDSFGPISHPNILDWFAAEAARGKPILAIGEEQPWTYQPRVMVTGPIRNFGALLEAVVGPLLEGKEPPRDQFGVDMNILGWRGMAPFNPELSAPLAARRVATPDLGTLGALDLALARLDQIREGNFEVFAGPLKDQGGRLRLPEGELGSFTPGFYETMDWLIDNVRDERPK